MKRWLHRQFTFGSGTKYLLVFALGALVCAATTGSRMWGYFNERSAEDLKDHEQAVSAAAVKAQAEAKRVADQQAELRADMKAHPEKYRVKWQQTFIRGSKELPVAKGQQTAGTAVAGTLWADIRAITPSLGPPSGTDPHAQSASVSAGGAGCSLSVVSWGYGMNIRGSLGIISMDGEDSEETRAAVAAWWNGSTDDYGWFWVWQKAVSVPGGSPGGISARTLSCAGWKGQDPAFGSVAWSGDTELTASYSIALANARRDAIITADPGPGQSGVRNPAQRTGDGSWHGDATTTVTATCGDATATGNFGLGGDTDITSAISGVSLAISLNSAPEIRTDYGYITVSNAEFDSWHTYLDADNNTAFHYHGTGGTAAPSDADVYWRTIGSGSQISVQRWDGGSGGTSFAGSFSKGSQTFNLRLCKERKTASGVPLGVYDYGIYDDSAGHPFDIGLYKAEGQTDADVSVAPGTHTYTQTTPWSPEIPGAAGWQKFQNVLDGFWVKLRKDWLVANNEDVVFTDPVTTKDLPRTEIDDNGNPIYYPLADLIQPVTFHGLTVGLDAAPWVTGWIESLRTELDLDKPPGTGGVRPSLWEGVDSCYTVGDVWHVPALGGTVERTLATRRRNRMTRFGAHLWTGLPGATQQEVSHEWPLMTRANMTVEETGDDPKWHDPEAEPWPGDEPGITWEDITDWRSFSCVKLSMTGATGDLPVSLKLTYRVLSGNDDFYDGAEWNFGSPEDGEATAAALWSEQQTALIAGKLQDGGWVFDLAPDAGQDPLDLELVEKVEFVFGDCGSDQELTITGWETVPYDDAHHIDDLRMRIALKHSTDWFGAQVSIDGMPDYAPTYLYGAQDAERVEVGYKHTQLAQHNPDYDGPPDDPTYLKALSRWEQENGYAESVLRVVYDQEAVDAELKDEDGVTLADPAWGDWDECGGCLHVGVNHDVSPLDGTALAIYCDTILQGGVRGISKTNGVRDVSKPSDSLTLLYSDNGGVTKTAIATTGTGYAGEYRVGAGREKTPRTYYLQGTGPVIYLGGFVNVEEVWKAARLAALEWLPWERDHPAVGYYRLHQWLCRLLSTGSDTPMSHSIASTLHDEVDFRAFGVHGLAGAAKIKPGVLLWSEDNRGLTVNDQPHAGDGRRWIARADGTL